MAEQAHKNEANKNLYWTIMEFEHWNLAVAASPKGLCYVDSAVESLEETPVRLAAWAANRYPGLSLVRDDEKLHPYTVELKNYMQGKLQRFTMPVELNGTPFQQAVWQALREIDFGDTAAYSDIALQVGKPSAVRAVGAAVGANPLLIVVPCHRVIGKNGSLTGFRGGLEMKTRLLQLEGHRMVEHSKNTVEQYEVTNDSIEKRGLKESRNQGEGKDA